MRRDAAELMRLTKKELVELLSQVENGYEARTQELARVQTQVNDLHQKVAHAQVRLIDQNLMQKRIRELEALHGQPPTVPAEAIGVSIRPRALPGTFPPKKLR